MPPAATILHADCDAFFASVEQRDDPKLLGKPVAVGGGVVMAASYEARAFGVRGAMGGGKARRLCPELIVVPPRFEAYVAASKELFAVFDDTAPSVEGGSLEEAFLDVRGLEAISGTPTAIARRLRKRVRRELGLPLSVGVARTKVLAKLASRAAKPDGLVVVEPGGERDFVLPLPVEALWGVGPATSARLHAAGIRTVRDAAARTEGELMAAAGRHAGRYIHAIAQGRDTKPVVRRRRRRSVGSQRALGSRPRSPAEHDEIVMALAERVTRRMRAKGRVGRTVTLRLRYGDYSRATRSRTLRRPTAGSAPVTAVLRGLLDDARPEIERRGLTLLGLTISNLDGEDSAQLELPLGDGSGRELDAALDRVRDRFGRDAMTRATLLGKDRGIRGFADL
jgi:DNA polymerase-4